jgi:hypothetical protein
MSAAIIAAQYANASTDTRRLVDRLLQQDADDQAWAEQIGPAYRQRDVALLLGKSKQAVSEDRRLLRLEMRSGAIGYPAFQFDGRRVLAGLGDIVVLLGPSVETPWTIGSWLTSPQPALGGARPIDRLRAGEIDTVMSAARHLSAALAG